MEILRDNFEEQLPLFKDSIDNCDFYAIDLEFSGKSNSNRPLNV